MEKTAGKKKKHLSIVTTFSETHRPTNASSETTATLPPAAPLPEACPGRRRPEGLLLVPAIF